jgi:hypothetical protein
MKQSQDVSYNGIPGVNIPGGEKGDILRDSNNRDLTFDFSGFSIGVGFSRGFNYKKSGLRATKGLRRPPTMYCTKQ